MKQVHFGKLAFLLATERSIANCPAQSATSLKFKNALRNGPKSTCCGEKKPLSCKKPSCQIVPLSMTTPFPHRRMSLIQKPLWFVSAERSVFKPKQANFRPFCISTLVFVLKEPNTSHNQPVSQCFSSRFYRKPSTTRPQFTCFGGNRAHDVFSEPADRIVIFSPR